jgi:hypothetical protein
MERAAGSKLTAGETLQAGSETVGRRFTSDPILSFSFFVLVLPPNTNPGTRNENDF